MTTHLTSPHSDRLHGLDLARFLAFVGMVIVNFQIVMGAEGSGLRPAVAKACAELAHIPICPAMESLNVSNAAAIAFYEASREGFPAT